MQQLTCVYDGVTSSTVGRSIVNVHVVGRSGKRSWVDFKVGHKHTPACLLDLKAF